MTREVGGQERVRGGDRADPGKTQLRTQAILERAKEPLDAALGLRRARQDELDPELGEGSAKLGGLAPAG